MPEWRLYARRESDRARLAEIDDYQSLTLVSRFNAVGAWELDIDVTTPAAAHLTWGAGLLVTLNDDEFFSGPIIGLNRKWTGDSDRLVVAGVDDSTWLARRLAYPEAPALTTATDAYDVRTGVASTIMRAYVNDNAGPAADSTRRVPGLVLAADPVLGPSITGRGRFQALQELLATLALAGGDLGFRVVQAGSSIEFQVYQPVNKTAAIVISPELGSLSEFEYREQGPEANFAVVGGSGQGAARVISAAGDSASSVRYGRMEVFVDRRDTTDAAELAQAREEELAAKADRSSLTAQPVDTEAFTFGTDYGLGDRVTVMIDGEPVQDVIREVQVRLTPEEGARAFPVVGTPGERDPRTPQLFNRLARLERLVRDLERRQ